MTGHTQRAAKRAPTEAQRVLGVRFRASFELYLAVVLQRAWSDEHVRGALRRRHVDIDSAVGRRMQRGAWNRRALALEEVSSWTEGWWERVGSVTAAVDARVGAEHVDSDTLVGVPGAAHLSFRPSPGVASRSSVCAVDVCVPARELTAGIPEIPAQERALYVHRLAAFGDRVIAGVHDSFVATNPPLAELRAPRPLDYDDLYAMVAQHFVQIDLLRPVERPSSRTDPLTY